MNGITSTRSLRVLIAEDHPTNRRMLQILLGRMGHQVDLARDGVEALERVECREYDVVLMDLHMPRMGGIEAARQIVTRWPDDRPHLVAVTADTTEEARAACEQVGMCAYIEKPIDRLILDRQLSLIKPRRRRVA